MGPALHQTSDSFSATSGRSENEEKYAEVNWDELGFSLTPTDYMYVMKCSSEGTFSQGNILPYGNIELSPCSSILNYGQGLFEGLKAYRTEKGRILLFRPDENAIRMKMGSERMCMPSPSIQHFVDAVKQTVLANKKWVPPPGKGSLYVRPLLIGSGARLGVGPAPEFTFVIYVSPVGLYHKGEQSLNLYIEDKIHRAAPGGTGGVKSVTNYSPVMKPLIDAKSKGFSDVLYVDAATGKYIEEVTACNIFILKGNTISTPAASGTILSGITRKSIIELASDFGYQVEERDVPVEELLDAEEVFCTGTAVVVTPVGSITFKDKRSQYETGEGTVARKLYETLTAIQTGRAEDKRGWTIQIC